ncbi:3-dehydroquinate dehydratase [Metallosphaera sp. J1]|uniref:type I 3-dehydroquinate dehydratase n=1 Tax=Metallosphaera javensis (ex Hofmann et al. 2022) TaxID=99938 RepID=UPI001EDD941B|nr:type I 3-dehydroquinate dehydratase [Metallosphaera javensis (ex Hofmann et al. 2022)]MCG3109746.1 3-dehydroquinate dehydratase [Metallosphaera javensis (ex Hofmann et al. 2022)]
MNRPLIVASLPVTRPDDIKRVKEIDADLVELRLDYSHQFPSPLDLVPLKHRIMVTLRDREEGGVGDFTDDFKEDYLNRLAELNILYDVEASFLSRRRVQFKNKVVSAHYFRSLPARDEIDHLFLRYGEAFTVKIAVGNVPGYREILSYISTKPNSTFMPMSPDPLERLGISLLGSKLLYTYVDSPTATGQLHYLEAKRILNCLFPG